MSLITIGKNGRRYPRKFDHDEAQRLRKDGWTYRALAEHFNVSEQAIGRVLNPNTRAAIDRHVRAYAWRKREPCKGGCGALVWRHGKRERARTGYCPACYGRMICKTVRENTLLCSTCHEWKPDEAFTERKDAISRRGRRWSCRRCETITRREHRHANREAANAYDREYKRRRKQARK